jgi:hypothetical protein
VIVTVALMTMMKGALKQVIHVIAVPNLWVAASIVVRA